MNYSRLAKVVLAEMDQVKPLWEWLSRRIMPRVTDAIRQVDPSMSRKRDLIDVAAESALMLAAAYYSYITPAGQQWVSFSGDKNDDRYERWFGKASETTLAEMSRSNFYAQAHECYISSVIFGSALMLIEDEGGGRCFYRSIPIGTYGWTENHKGDIQTVARRFEYTADQAAGRFGLEALPPRVQQAHAREESRFTEKFAFIHLVTPRDGYTAGNGLPSSPMELPFASVYMLEGEEYHVVEESGYPEFPYMCSRFLRWPGSVWGYPPACKCLTALASVGKIDNNMDLLSDLAAFPRILKLAEQVGEIDFRAGGQTVISREAAAAGLPKEWGTQGRYDVGQDRIREKEDKIRSAFYVPFLQPISNKEQQMTATEVRALQEEQALSFSPAFAQFVTDLNPLLYRVFSIMYRAGRYNSEKHTQPEGLKVMANDGTDNYSIAMPQVSMHGKISQALEQSQTSGLHSFLMVLQTYLQATGDQQALDYFDRGKAIKHIYLSTGAPEDILLTDDQVAQARAAQAQQQEAMMQSQMALQQAQAANQAAQAQTNKIPT